MKPLRLVPTPTRNRRLNEILGLVVAVCAVLLFLALATYSPADPSLNTAGGLPPQTQLHATLGASNWTGVIGAYLADALLQIIGIAAFFLPIVLGRVGICWIRQRAAGSATARFTGLALWLVFAPALLGLLPRTLFWRHALPIEGVVGRLIADLLVQYLNLPGATIVLLLMVAMSLYLATTFTFLTAREWIEAHFSLVRRLHERWQERKVRRAVNLKFGSAIPDRVPIAIFTPTGKFQRPGILPNDCIVPGGNVPRWNGPPEPVDTVIIVVW